MQTLGIDLGSSSVKVALVDHATGQTLADAQFPDQEMSIDAPQPGWAEQQPDRWWDVLTQALRRLAAKHSLRDVRAIGIGYQMHGLVCVDADGNALRPSIIWCDSRAVPYGEGAFQNLGPDRVLPRLLNSPGNFTAAKLAWVRDHEPDVYARIDKIMLPGDYLALRMTGETHTSITGLSEGIFWDFQDHRAADFLLDEFGFDPSLLPAAHGSFGAYGQLRAAVAGELGLPAGIPVTYRAGDQPNNALSLNVLEPGQVAATAGTSGVVYGVTDQVKYDPKSRVNTFAHVNHRPGEQTRLGVLLCINGVGIANAWTRRLTGATDYATMNAAAAKIQPGAEGLRFLPFGNGAERMLENKHIGASLEGLDLVRHGQAHVYRAVVEGIAFAFRYGVDLMREVGVRPELIRAGYANMFLSPDFRQTVATLLGSRIELYNTNGAVGAAVGAAIGAEFKQADEAFANLRVLETVTPDTGTQEVYETAYQEWKSLLGKRLEGV